jgi:NDP-sugar pyrophosphorylase family protein
MQALILAGGKGTRLRPLTVYTPKPVVPVLNRPFLLYQIDILKRAGISDITLSLNYQPDRISDVLGDGSKYGVKLTYLTEPQPLGTAGAYRFAAGVIDKPTVVLNGDILTDLKIADMVAFHGEKKAVATIFLTEVENPAAYGLVETTPGGRVKQFLEKPKAEDIASLTTRNINAGIYILEPEILDLIPENENRSFEYDVFPELLKQEKDFFAYTGPGIYWRDIGNPRSYLDAHADLLAGKLEGHAADKAGKESYLKNGVSIDEASLIGSDCIIKSGVKIINSVIGNGVHLDEKVVVENSVIWPHARIGVSSNVTGAFLGRGCQIGNNVSIGNGSVLGDKTVLASYTQV